MKDSNQYDIVWNYLNNDNTESTDIRKDRDFIDDAAYRAEMRVQQINRANTVSRIFDNYKIQQDERYKYKKKMKPVIFWVLIGIVLALTVSFVVFSSVLLFKDNDFTNPELIRLITACVTYLTSLISIFLIIVKYVFPMDEEKNFNNLVSAIITNDTERIKNDNDYLTQNKK